jgi:hypothetical protein
MKLRTLVLFSLLALLCPHQASATQPASKCAVVNSTTCALGSGTGTNQTIVLSVYYAAGVSPTTPTDGFVLTYTQIRCDGWTDGIGSEHICSYYAHTASNSGADTITVSGSAARAIWAGSWAATDVKNTGSPVDQSCFATGGIPTGTSSFSTCSISSTQTNDIFAYMVSAALTSSSSCNFTSANGATNGPSVQNDVGVDANCAFFFTNVNFSSNAVIASGAPSTTTTAFSSTNTGGQIGTFGVQLVTLLPPPSAGVSDGDSVIINFKPPKRRDSIPQSSPRLLYAILRKQQAYEVS